MIVEEIVRNKILQREILLGKVLPITEPGKYIRMSDNEIIIFNVILEKEGLDILYRKPLECYVRRNIYTDNKVMRTTTLNGPSQSDLDEIERRRDLREKKNQIRKDQVVRREYPKRQLGSDVFTYKFAFSKEDPRALNLE